MLFVLLLCVGANSLRRAEVLNSDNTRKFTMAIRSGDWVSRSINARGRWEISDPREMAELYHRDLAWVLNISNGRGLTFLDVGANIGYYTFLFAHHGYNVIAIEPMQMNLEAINTTLRMNPAFAQRVRVVPAAVGDIDAKQCTVQSSKHHNSGNGKLACGRACQEGNDCSHINLVTVDSLLARIAPVSVDVVKVDIEGAECGFIKGASTLFTEYRPKLVQFEMNRDSVRACVPPFMAAHGYVKGAIVGHDFNTVWVPNELDQKLPATPPPEDCVPWNCSCQEISNRYGTAHNIWGNLTSRSIRRWWVRYGCRTHRID
jgi:FkbM family methyltransferase